MNIGDMVEWTSQAAGNTKKKRGKIVGVVFPGEDPLDPLLVTDHALELDGGYGRSHESYLVSVDRGPKRKPALYWPIVKRLKVVQAVASPALGATETKPSQPR